MDEKKLSPLMPIEALEYFLDSESSNRLYLRATSIRNCLENIVETIFFHILDEEQKKGWNKKNLNARLNTLSDFFPDDINDKLHGIRKLGNKGAHQSGHKELVEGELEMTLMDLSQICEWTITTYFVKNGFTEHPWIPTVFSTLPPIYRIRTLEEVLASESKKVECAEILCYLEEVQDYHEKVITGQVMPRPYEEPSENEKRLGGFLLLIDKLSMAYLKNRERIKSIEFVNEMYDKGFINDLFKEQMLDKLDSLWQEIDNLPISANLEETRKNLDKVLPAVKKDEESLFVTLFTAITSHSS
jgi:hypothetical protein